MPEADIVTVEQKLEQTLVQLKNTNEPERKRALLKQMRSQMAELDRIVLDHIRFATL